MCTQTERTTHPKTSGSMAPYSEPSTPKIKPEQRAPTPAWAHLAGSHLIQAVCACQRTHSSIFFKRSAKIFIFLKTTPENFMPVVLLPRFLPQSHPVAGGQLSLVTHGTAPQKTRGTEGWVHRPTDWWRMAWSGFTQIAQMERAAQSCLS